MTVSFGCVGDTPYITLHCSVLHFTLLLQIGLQWTILSCAGRCPHWPGRTELTNVSNESSGQAWPGLTRCRLAASVKGTALHSPVLQCNLGLFFSSHPCPGHIGWNFRSIVPGEIGAAGAHDLVS